MVLPVRQLASLVGARLRSDRDAFVLPRAVEERVARSLIGLRRRRARVVRKEVVAAGFRLPYLEGGRGEEAVVLVHGFADNKDSFVDVAALLRKRYRVVLPDLPGFGEASKPLSFRYSLQGVAEVFGAGLDRLGLERVHLVGNSLGGGVVAEYALRHPERVRSLTLIGSIGVPVPHRNEFERRIDAGDNPFALSSYAEWEAFIAMVLERPPFMPAVVRRHMARIFLGSSVMHTKILDDLLAHGLDLSLRLRRLPVPTLLVWGDRDRLIDVSAARVFLSALPDARLEMLGGIGHCPQVESPRQTARLLRTHFSGDRGTAAG